MLEDRKLLYRVGTVYTTVDRNWELAASADAARRDLPAQLAVVAVDMEAATVAANGFR